MAENSLRKKRAPEDRLKSVGEPTNSNRYSATICSFSISNSQSNGSSRQMPEQVCFDRTELNQLLRVYGFAVASGEWRDYAIDMLKERAVFSVFRRSSEMPLYMIEKNPKLRRKQGAYSIINANGLVLKRGHELAQLLKYFEKKPKLVAL